MSDQGQERTSIQIPLKWEGIEDLDTRYANEMLITHAGGREFLLIFGEVQIPLILNPEVDKPPKVVKVKPVAKIAISHEMMIRFASAISENVGMFLEKVDEA